MLLTNVAMANGRLCAINGICRTKRMQGVLFLHLAAQRNDNSQLSLNRSQISHSTPITEAPNGTSIVKKNCIEVPIKNIFV